MLTPILLFSTNIYFFVSIIQKASSCLLLLMVASLDQAFGSMDTGSSLGGGSRSGGGLGGGEGSGFRGEGGKASGSSLKESKYSAPSKQIDLGSSDTISNSNKSSEPQQSYHDIPYPLTTEERLQTLSHEIQKQKEYMEQNRVGYIDKLMSKRRDILKMIMFCLVILLALSSHMVIKHYYRSFLDTTDLTPTKEFFVRIAYPLVILFALWNSRLFIRV
jgi:hypothetical protein